MAYEPKTFERYPVLTGPEGCRGCPVAEKEVTRVTNALRHLRRFDDRSENISAQDRTCYISFAHLTELELNQDTEFLAVKEAYEEAAIAVKALYQHCRGGSALSSKDGVTDFCGHDNATDFNN